MTVDSSRTVLIGIPSCRRPRGLRRLLASLANQTGVEDVSVEIFVAENDAAGRAAMAVCRELDGAFRWTIVGEIVEEIGISAARNAILDRARLRQVRFLAMVDDDEIAAPDWLSSLLGAQSRYGADVVAGPMDYAFEQQPSKAVSKCGLFVARDLPEGIVRTLIGSPNVLFDCTSLEAVGWPRFRSEFGLTGGEDRDYFNRLRQAGLSFAWAPQARTCEIVAPERLELKWILRRTLSLANTDMRFMLQEEGALPIAVSLGKSVAFLAASPVCVWLLPIPSARLWVLGRWSRSVGKIMAFLGHRFREYDRHRITRDAA